MMIVLSISRISNQASIVLFFKCSLIFNVLKEESSNKLLKRNDENLTMLGMEDIFYQFLFLFRYL